MKEIRAIVNAYKEINISSKKIALATVINVQGSSYRSPGAKMLITDDGRWTGTISGGCLEGDALRKARQVMRGQKSIVVTYDTREESNQQIGIGLGCNGLIDVLIEPVSQGNENNPINFFERIIELDEPCHLYTTYETGECRRLLANHDQIIMNTISPALLTIIKTLTKEPGQTKALSVHVNERFVPCFYEYIEPTVQLLIFGAGFDSRPVAQLAKTLGWRVTVTDECVAHVAPKFFPTADQVSMCDRKFIERDLRITPYTACVLMSHNYEYDRDVLKKIINSDASYIGILGPRKRFEKMLAEFQEMNIKLTSSHLHKIHSPVGLDIGGETPDEIAVSIIAEIQSKFSKRSGGFLKYRNAPIHQRDVTTDKIYKDVFLDRASAEVKSA